MKNNENPTGLRAPKQILMLLVFLFQICLLQIFVTASAVGQDDGVFKPLGFKYSEAIEKLEAAVEYEVKQKNLPAFSIAIVDGDKVAWSKGYGFQDADKKVPATADTIYRVGSISKLLTDISVMKLVESGDLDLDKPVTTYLPDFKPNNKSGTPITLRQLMTHRSGLVRESPVGNYFDPTEPGLAKTVASLNGTPIIYPPNTKTKYSNAAIAVVGTVLESKLKGKHC